MPNFSCTRRRNNNQRSSPSDHRVGATPPPPGDKPGGDGTGTGTGGNSYKAPHAPSLLGGVDALSSTVSSSDLMESGVPRSDSWKDIAAFTEGLSGMTTLLPR